MDILGHSTFLKNCLDNNIIDSIESPPYRSWSGSVSMSTVSEPTPKILNTPPDPRLKSEQFREDVRLVMADLEIENNGKNFREYDSIIDWVEYAENLRA